MKTINTALLSFGMSGRVFHAPFIHLHPGFNLMGAWERSTKKIQEYYPYSISYSSLDDVLNDKNIELIIVNTPTYTHFEYAKKALLAGKDIVVEKAFTTTLEEAIELKKIASEQNKKIAVFQNRRWDSDFLTCKKVLQEGTLGNIVEAEFYFARFNPAISPKKHKEDPGPGAGIVKDLGPHLIDQALHLFGMPNAVYADIRNTRPESQVDDLFNITLYYKDKRVKLKAGYYFKEVPASFILYGTNGSFLKSRADVQEPLLLKDEKPNLTDWGTEPEEESGIINYLHNGETIRKKITTEKGNYYYFYDGVYNALNTLTPMPVTTDDGINVMRLIEAAFEASKSQKIIELQ